MLAAYLPEEGVVLLQIEVGQKENEIVAAPQLLRQLADKLSEGQVVLRQGSDEITLDMPTSLILEIQVEDEDKKQKGIQHSLEVEIKWFEGEDAGGPLELG